MWQRVKDFFFNTPFWRQLADGFRPSTEIQLYEELDWSELEREYQGCCEVHSADLSAGDGSWADELARLWIEVIQYVYRLKRLPDELINRDIVTLQAQTLIKPIDRILQDVNWDSPDYIMREILKKNMWHFSVAKNYNDCVAINNLLIREDGSLRPWHDFKREAQKIAGNSVRYLKTEYNTVVAGAQMSRKWQEIQRDKHLFPYVMFDVVKDGHTSDICRPLHNVIVRADDPMLMYYFPPNHFNCRTDVRRLRYGKPTEKYRLPEIPEAFKNNAGMSGSIFTNKNKYIENTPKETLLLANKIQLKEQRNSIKSWAKENLLDKKVKHPNVEKEIGFSVTGIKEALNQPHKHLILKNEAIKILRN